MYIIKKLMCQISPSNIQVSVYNFQEVKLQTPYLLPQQINQKVYSDMEKL